MNIAAVSTALLAAAVQIGFISRPACRRPRTRSAPSVKRWPEFF